MYRNIVKESQETGRDSENKGQSSLQKSASRRERHVICPQGFQTTVFPPVVCRILWDARFRGLNCQLFEAQLETLSVQCAFSFSVPSERRSQSLSPLPPSALSWEEDRSVTNICIQFQKLFFENFTQYLHSYSCHTV